MITAIILAAGESKRMRRNKLLLPIGDKPVIDILILAVKDVVDDIIVILGHRPGQLIPHLKRNGVKWRINPEYMRGMVSSFKVGVKAAKKSDAILLILGDQPTLRKKFLKKMIDEWQRGKGNIISPICKGKKGHPILFDKTLFEEILQLKEEETIRDVIHRNKHVLFLIETGEWAIMDMDTAEDIERIKKYVASQ